MRRPLFPQKRMTVIAKCAVILIKMEKLVFPMRMRMRIKRRKIYSRWYLEARRET